MSDLLKGIREIERGRNLEMNLPKYMNSMMSAYHRYSCIRLSLNYYTYFEMEQEMGQESESKPLGLMKLTERVDKVMRDAILAEFDEIVLENAVKETDQIRNEIICDMKTITLYADQFQIYEYMINRIEGRYEEVEALPLNYSDDKFVKRLAEYILKDRDNSVINSKMMEVVSNLPIRLTRQRYYEIIKDSFLLFEGSERQALEDHIFLLKSSAALIEPETDEVRYQDLNSILHSLRSADYDSLTLEAYQDLKQKLSYVSAYIERMTSLYMLLIEVVNDVYILLLSMPYALTDVDETAIYKEIMRRVQGLSKEVKEDDTLYDLFARLEGKQERISEQLSANAYLLDTLEEKKELMESMMLDKIYLSLQRMEKLASTSHFIELDAPIDKTPVERSYAEQRANEVIREFAECFKMRSRREIRSIMASSMMALPVFFQNIDEFEEYAKVALMSCSDAEEKRSSVVLLKMIMESCNGSDT